MHCIQFIENITSKILFFTTLDDGIHNSGYSENIYWSGVYFYAIFCQQNNICDQAMATAAAAKAKAKCKYGSKCYRKNKAHFDEYCHPEDGDTDTEMGKS